MIYYGQSSADLMGSRKLLEIQKNRINCYNQNEKTFKNEEKYIKMYKENF